MLTSPVMGFIMPSTNELLIIGLIVIVLFGGTRIPQLMRGVGEGIREFRKGVSDVNPAKEGTGSGNAN